MSGRTRQCPPLDDDQMVALRELVEEVNGFMYAGHRTAAICDAVDMLRDRPDLAKKLGIGEFQ